MCNEKTSTIFVYMKKYTIQKIVGRIIPFVLFFILIPISLICSLGIRLQDFIRKVFQR